jgi:hypothetical protein
MLVLAALFVLAGGLVRERDGHDVLLLTGAGAIFGAIAVPEIHPGLVRRPTLWQMASGALGGLLLAFFLHAGVAGQGFAVTIGLIAGYLAPFWIRELQLP